MPSRSLILALSLAATGPALCAWAMPPSHAPAGIIVPVGHKFECSQVKDPDLAVVGCKALIKANPDDGEAYLSLGLAYERIGAGSEALDAFIAASNVGHKRIEANERDADAWVLIAMACRGSARIAKDEPDMRKDFVEAARAASERATYLGVRVPPFDETE